MQCKGRYCREKKELKFPLKSGYFTERRCTEIASSEDGLCTGCLEKSKLPFVNKNQQYFYQGKVDEPYFENSWLFGSKRFLEFNEIPGNALSPEAFAYAEAAQRIARQGLQIQEVPMPPKKTAPQSQPKQAKQAKEKIPLPTQLPSASPSKIKSLAVESPEEPLEALEVRKVTLKRVTYESVDYWVHSNTLQMYSITPFKQIQGILWDTEEEKPRNQNPEADLENE